MVPSTIFDRNSVHISQLLNAVILRPKKVCIRMYIARHKHFLSHFAYGRYFDLSSFWKTLNIPYSKKFEWYAYLIGLGVYLMIWTFQKICLIWQVDTLNWTREHFGVPWTYRFRGNWVHIMRICFLSQFEHIPWAELEDVLEYIEHLVFKKVGFTLCA